MNVSKIYEENTQGKCHHENEGQQLEKLLITMASLAPPHN
jgi:hypothetical protein